MRQGGFDRLAEFGGVGRDKIDASQHPGGTGAAQDMGCGRGAIGPDAVHRPHQVEIAKVEQLDTAGGKIIDRNMAFGQEVIGAGVVEEGAAVARHGHHMGMGGQRRVCDDHAVGRQGGGCQGGKHRLAVQVIAHKTHGEDRQAGGESGQVQRHIGRAAAHPGGFGPDMDQIAFARPAVDAVDDVHNPVSGAGDALSCGHSGARPVTASPRSTAAAGQAHPLPPSKTAPAVPGRNCRCGHRCTG